MKKRKLVSIILIVGILVSSLVGCSSGNKQSESKDTSKTQSSDNSKVEKESSSASGKVTFWNDKLAGAAEIAKKLTDAWSSSSGFTVDINSYTDTASYQTAMSQSIDNADAAPNVFTWWSGEQLETFTGNKPAMLVACAIASMPTILLYLFLNKNFNNGISYQSK